MTVPMDPEQPPEIPPPPIAPAPLPRSPGLGWKVACGVLAAATFAFGVAWSAARSRASDLEAQVEAFERSEAAAAREADARPALLTLAEGIDIDDSAVDYSGDDQSLDVTLPIPTSDALAWLEAFMEEAGMPGGTIERMEQTRALDGTQTTNGDKVTLTWTYHPDDGLSAVFSVDD